MPVAKLVINDTAEGVTEHVTQAEHGHTNKGVGCAGDMPGQTKIDQADGANQAESETK